MNVPESTAPRHGVPGELVPPEARGKGESPAAANREGRRTTEVGASAQAETGYYGLPLLKPPPWKLEIPAYLAVGGAGGAAGVIALVGRMCGADRRLIQDARRLAAGCGALSPPLLVADLGRPARFLNMFRVFKVQSPMSVGSWTLGLFSTSAAASAFFNARRESNRILKLGSEIACGLSGLALSTYTGVLLGCTAIPVWSENVTLLPLHFAASSLGSAASLLELAHHLDSAPLNVLGIVAAASETAVAARIELQSKPALRPLKSGVSGGLARAASILSGPVPLALRLLAHRASKRRSIKLRRAAAVSAIAGSVLSRVAWVKAGNP